MLNLMIPVLTGFENFFKIIYRKKIKIANYLQHKNV